MFKNGTLACAVIMTLVAQPVVAERNCSPLYLEVSKAISDGKSATIVDQLKKNVEDCETKQFSEVNQCKANAESEYTQAVKELQDACDSMGLRSSTNSSIGCSYNVEQCRCATKGLSVTQKAYLNCDQVDTTKLKYCPEVTEAMQDRMEKRREKNEDKIENAKKELRALEDEIAKADDKQAEGKSKARAARAAAEKEYAQGLAEMKKEKNQREQERIQKMSGYQEQMLTTQDQIRAVPAKLRDVERRRVTSQNGVYAQCVNTAQAAINALQTDAIAQIRAGAFNVGVQNDVFRNVGLTDLDVWQRKVTRRVNKCMASPETAIQKKNVDTQAASEADQINNTELKSAEAKADELRRLMAEVQAQCLGGARSANGEAVQSQACRDQDDTNTKQTALNEAKRIAVEQANADERDAEEAADRARTTARNKAGPLLTDINGKEDVLRNMDDADKVNASYPGGSSSAERAKLLSTKFAAAIDEAIQIRNCCGRPNSTINSQSCTSAKKLLTELGRTEPGDSTTASTTRRAPEPGGAGGTDGQR